MLLYIGNRFYPLNEYPRHPKHLKHRFPLATLADFVTKACHLFYLSLAEFFCSNFFRSSFLLIDFIHQNLG